MTVILYVVTVILYIMFVGISISFHIFFVCLFVTSPVLNRLILGRATLTPTSSTVQKEAWACLYIFQMSGYCTGKMTNRRRFSRSKGSSSVSEPFLQSLSLKPFYKKKNKKKDTGKWVHIFPRQILYSNRVVVSFALFISAIDYRGQPCLLNYEMGAFNAHACFLTTSKTKDIPHLNVYYKTYLLVISHFRDGLVTLPH